MFAKKIAGEVVNLGDDLKECWDFNSELKRILLDSYEHLILDEPMSDKVISTFKLLFRVNEIGKNSRLDPSCYLPDNILLKKNHPNEVHFDNLNSVLRVPDVQKSERLFQIIRIELKNYEEIPTEVVLNVLALYHSVRSQAKNPTSFLFNDLGDIETAFFEAIVPDYKNKLIPFKSNIISFYIFDLITVNLISYYQYLNIKDDRVKHLRWQLHFSSMFSKYESMFHEIGPQGEAYLGIFDKIMKMQD